MRDGRAHTGVGETLTGQLRDEEYKRQDSRSQFPVHLVRAFALYQLVDLAQEHPRSQKPGSLLFEKEVRCDNGAYFSIRDLLDGLVDDAQLSPQLSGTAPGIHRV